MPYLHISLSFRLSDLQHSVRNPSVSHLTPSSKVDLPMIHTCLRLPHLKTQAFLPHWQWFEHIMAACLNIKRCSFAVLAADARCDKSCFSWLAGYQAICQKLLTTLTINSAIEECQCQLELCGGDGRPTSRDETLKTDWISDPSWRAGSWKTRSMDV